MFDATPVEKWQFYLVRQQSFVSLFVVVVVVFSFLCLLVYSVVVVAGLFGEHVYFLSPHS